ncbi:hypothetical protein TNCV_2415511 [Trichonephila clavipes]|nr:hypothetical protein TNCV_2415511 [Trichonephila clavipes]
MKWGIERWSPGRLLSWSRADRAIEDSGVSLQIIISPNREVELRWTPRQRGQAIEFIKGRSGYSKEKNAYRIRKAKQESPRLSGKRTQFTVRQPVGRYTGNSAAAGGFPASIQDRALITGRRLDTGSAAVSREINVKTKVIT